MERETYQIEITELYRMAKNAGDYKFAYHILWENAKSIVLKPDPDKKPS